MIYLKLCQVIGSPYATGMHEATRCRKELLYYLPFHRAVTLSFEGIKSITSLFIREALEYIQKNHGSEVCNYLIVTAIENAVWKEKIEGAYINVLD